jgi:hypothetical protein
MPLDLFILRKILIFPSLIPKDFSGHKNLSSIKIAYYKYLKNHGKA